MCGICGIASPDLAQPVDADLLRRMNARIIHRGPDSDGFYIDGGFGMAMRRLAIIDVRGGDQPISSEDGQVLVTFNGEIFNFQELRRDLEQRGHRFATSSDTEVIVHGYEEWGDDALLRFNGMFACAIWDRRRGAYCSHVTAWGRNRSTGGIIRRTGCCGGRKRNAS